MSIRWVVIFGGGGHGKVVADVAASSGWCVEAFIDDRPERDGTLWFGLPVLSWDRFRAERDRWAEAAVALAIGDNPARERCHARLEREGLRIATLIHARATVASSASLGDGTVVMAGAVVNPDAVIGAGAILNTNCVVEHDCRLGRFVHLSPTAALGGTVTLGDRVHVGLGAVVLPGKRVGSDARIGAGAVVNADVPDELTVVGVPARPIAKGTK